MAKRPRTRLGAPFAWLLGAGGSSNLVDGLLLAAGPLMVAQLTADPFFVALAVVAQQIPWLLFGLLAGVIADRRSRVGIIAIGSAARALTLFAVAAFLLTGAMSLPVLYAALFLIGTTEAFMDNAWSSLVPDVVPSEHLGVANARSSGVMTLTNQLLGPAIGGLLFAIGAAVPYGGAALLSAAAVVLVLRVRVAPSPRPGNDTEPAVDLERPSTGVIPVTVAPVETDPDGTDDAVRAAQHDGPGATPSERAGLVRTVLDDIAEGARWLWAHAPVRVLALVIFFFNITFGMTWSMLVLWSTERLGLGPEGYGALLAVSAVGGMLAAAGFPRLERSMPYGRIIRIALVLETLLHVAIAVTTNAIVAFVIVFVFGVYATSWGALANTIRGRLVPTHVRGRVTSVYLLGVVGGMAGGALLGGLIGQGFGVVAPMWVAGALNVVLLAFFWRWLHLIGAAGQHTRSPDASG
ncbi:MFS transporter [Pseudoclavibacter chungangensis]|uniref:MFS transporter n=1 Tax=Pseudoclavibacter chungangensis TaxID=587635 RepID=A0A7J5BNI7_9MICO|nr:MFS transporter [Pseudoclavibacter chungangensis]KAB1653646.1 MFS transporter [Pseudoclavibacter chungangensis]NYJ68760.1 MFS family permease [Pseudoclavibacter chungangensis]